MTVAAPIKKSMVTEACRTGQNGCRLPCRVLIKKGFTGGSYPLPPRVSRVGVGWGGGSIRRVCVGLIRPIVSPVLRLQARAFCRDRPLAAPPPPQPSPARDARGGRGKNVTPARPPCAGRRRSGLRPRDGG